MTEALDRARSERRLRGILDAAGVAVATLDVEGHVATSSGAFAEVWQRRSEDLLGLHLIGICAEVDRAELLAAFIRTIEGVSEVEHCDLAVPGLHGVGATRRLTLGRIADGSGRTTEVVAVITDATPGSDRTAELPTHQLGDLAQPLAHALRRSARSGRAFALLCVDPGDGARDSADLLDRFEARLAAQLRPTDETVQVMSLGVFVLATDLGDVQDAAGIAYRVLSSAVEPLACGDGSEVRLTPTIGVVVADGTSAASRLLPSATTALADALADGVGGFRIIDLRSGLAA
jgi:PAS domain S-box-containing protein